MSNNLGWLERSETQQVSELRGERVKLRGERVKLRGERVKLRGERVKLRVYREMSHQLSAVSYQIKKRAGRLVRAERNPTS